MRPGQFALAILLLALNSPARTVVVNPALPGATDTNPGSDAQPLRTISSAAALVEPGDVVQIHAGVYREKVSITQSGTREQPIRFEAAPGAAVIITGADPLTNWSKGPQGTYSVPWPHRLFQGDAHNPGGAEQVFVAGKLLRKAPSLDALTDGTFFVDLQGKRLYLRAGRNPDETLAERPVEGSTRSEVWLVTGAYVQTRGLCFRYAANRAQRGMAQFLGSGDIVEDCVFEWSNSTGAHFAAEDITVRRCVFRDNGQQGFGAVRAHRFRLDGCTVQRNNVKNYPRDWEAGAFKICLSRGAILENSRFIKNRGSGIWFDISNEDATVRNCLIADNEDAGIFYEISYRLHAHDNVIVGNGNANTRGAWGANGGICISSSPGCLIERNLLVGNHQGFCFREQNRTTHSTEGNNAGEVPVWVHDEVVRNNLLLNNLNAQVQGWFDIASERHWPKAMQTGNPEGRRATQDLAAGYQARKDGVPPGLSLEDLKLTFAGNCYAMAPGQAFFVWGANRKRKEGWKDLPSLTKALGFEDTESQVLSLPPLDVAGRDFRLPGEVFKRLAHAYPQGKVPDCLLGPR